MKTILILAAAAATLATSNLAQAGEPARGHWEWRGPISVGPKSTPPVRTRVWVKDGPAEMADCNCAMMKMSAADCMMDMPGKPKASSAG